MSSPAHQRRSANTQRAYRADWDDFSAWCGRRGFSALPARVETVALYVGELADAGRTRATLRRRLAAIGQAHAAAGKEAPTHAALLREIVASAPAGDAARRALTLDELRALVATLDDDLRGRRDRALLLLGFGGALRRGELVALDAERVEARPEGLLLRREAARPLGLARWPDAAMCPTQATLAWLAIADISQGPLFRALDRHGHLGAERLSDRAVALVVKRAAQAAGLDPARYAGESLRQGGLAAQRGGEGDVDWRLPPRAA